MRPTLHSCLLVSALALACSEPATNDLAPTPNPSPSSVPRGGEASAPKPAEPSSAPAQPAEPEQAQPAQPEQAGECRADSDCTTTALPVTPITSEADCCFPTCQKRVASRAEVDKLQPLYGTSCKAVLCAPQSCTQTTDPVPVCREGRCIAGP